MRNIAVVLIAMTLASMAYADDAQPTAPKAAPKTPATNTRSGKVNGQLVDSMSFEKLQAQMLASQEARLPLVEREIELRYRTPLKVLGDPDSSALLARYIHSLYENLIKEGFTKEEALQIASRVPFPPALSGPPY
jgi:hypothetical protein